MLLSAKYFKLPDTKSRKLSPRWVGPFEVIAAVGSHKLAYELKLPQVVARMHPVFHVSALRPYLSTGNYQPPPIIEMVNGEPYFEVAYISSTRYSGARREYRVHWEGDRDHDSWERAADLPRCPDKIREFWESKNLVNPDL